MDSRLGFASNEVFRAAQEQTGSLNLAFFGFIYPKPLDRSTTLILAQLVAGSAACINKSIACTYGQIFFPPMKLTSHPQRVYHAAVLRQHPQYMHRMFP